MRDVTPLLGSFELKQTVATIMERVCFGVSGEQPCLPLGLGSDRFSKVGTMSPTIKFFTDEHTDKQIAIQLRQQHGIDIVRCEEVGLKEAPDFQLLAYAAENGRIMLTCDTDFQELHWEWLVAGKNHAGIAFVTHEICNEIGVIVQELAFWHEAVQAGAATLESDFQNQLRFINAQTGK